MDMKTTTSYIAFRLLCVSMILLVWSSMEAANAVEDAYPEKLEKSETVLHKIGGTGSQGNVTIYVETRMNNNRADWRFIAENFYAQEVYFDSRTQAECYTWPKSFAGNLMPGQRLTTLWSWCSPPEHTMHPEIKFLWGKVVDRATRACLAREGVHPIITDESGPCPGSSNRVRKCLPDRGWNNKMAALHCKFTYGSRVLGLHAVSEIINRYLVSVAEAKFWLMVHSGLDKTINAWPTPG